MFLSISVSASLKYTRDFMSDQILAQRLFQTVKINNLFARCYIVLSDAVGGFIKKSAPNFELCLKKCVFFKKVCHAGFEPRHSKLIFSATNNF